MHLKIDILHALVDNYIFAITHKETKDVILVDPGDAKSALAYLDHEEKELSGIWLTHHHFDHTAGVEALKTAHPECVVVGAKKDAYRLPALDVALGEGDSFVTGEGLVVETFSVPGHTLGHIVYVLPEHKIIFVGDTLFNMGCGRVFEGTHQEMIESLEKIAKFSDEMLIYSAHEYTLANSAFAKNVFDQKNNQDAYQKLLKFEHKNEKLQEQGRATIPFKLGFQKELNPFLACLTNDGRNLYGCRDLSATGAFTYLRQQKDNF